MDVLDNSFCSTTPTRKPWTISWMITFLNADKTVIVIVRILVHKLLIHLFICMCHLFWHYHFHVELRGFKCFKVFRKLVFQFGFIVILRLSCSLFLKYWAEMLFLLSAEDRSENIHKVTFEEMWNFTLCTSSWKNTACYI